MVKKQSVMVLLNRNMAYLITLLRLYLHRVQSWYPDTDVPVPFELRNSSSSSVRIGTILWVALRPAAAAAAAAECVSDSGWSPAGCAASG